MYMMRLKFVDINGLFVVFIGGSNHVYCRHRGFNF